MDRYSIQIKNNSNWDLNNKSYFDFEGTKDLNTFCFRLSSIMQKEIRACQNNSNQGGYFHPSSADTYLDVIIK